MGSVLGKQMSSIMDENFKKNQEFMLSAQKMQVERQLQMQQQMRSRMVAQQLAMARERMTWWSWFYGIAGVGLLAGFARTKHPLVIAPLIPLTFVVGYQADLAWGNKMERVIAMADELLEKEPAMTAMPGKPLTVSLLDEGRKAAK